MTKVTYLSWVGATVCIIILLAWSDTMSDQVKLWSDIKPNYGRTSPTVGQTYTMYTCSAYRDPLGTKSNAWLLLSIILCMVHSPCHSTQWPPSACTCRWVQPAIPVCSLLYYVLGLAYTIGGHYDRPWVILGAPWADWLGFWPMSDRYNAHWPLAAMTRRWDSSGSELQLSQEPSISWSQTRACRNTTAWSFVLGPMSAIQ